jgi:hypothetical protein
METRKSCAPGGSMMLRAICIIALLSGVSPFVVPNRVQRAGTRILQHVSPKNTRRPLFEAVGPNHRHALALRPVPPRHKARLLGLSSSNAPREQTVPNKEEDAPPEASNWGYSQTLLRYLANWVSARETPQTQLPRPTLDSSVIDAAQFNEAPGPGPAEKSSALQREGTWQPATSGENTSILSYLNQTSPEISADQGIRFEVLAATILETALKYMGASNESGAPKEADDAIAKSGKKENISRLNPPHPLYGMDDVMLPEQELRKFDRAVKQDEEFFTFMRNLAFWKPEYWRSDLETEQDDLANSGLGHASVLEEVGEDLPAAMENATAAALNALNDTVPTDMPPASVEDTVAPVASSSWFSGASQVRCFV